LEEGGATLRGAPSEDRLRQSPGRLRDEVGGATDREGGRENERGEPVSRLGARQDSERDDAPGFRKLPPGSRLPTIARSESEREAAAGSREAPGPWSVREAGLTRATCVSRSVRTVSAGSVR